MPKTPDRHPGSAYDNDLQIVDDGLGDPTLLGSVHYVGGAFRQRDAVGLYDPRRAWCNVLDGQTSDIVGTTLYKRVTGSPLPLSIDWYSDAAMTLHLSSVAYTYLVGTSLANQIVYKLYAADGNTVIKTATDTITYVGTTETSRSRSFS